MTRMSLSYVTQIFFKILFFKVILFSLLHSHPHRHQKNFSNNLKQTILSLSLLFCIYILWEVSGDNNFSQSENRINHYCWQTNALKSVLGCFAIKICCDFVITKLDFGFQKSFAKHQVTIKLFSYHNTFNFAPYYFVSTSNCLSFTKKNIVFSSSKFLRYLLIFGSNTYNGVTPSVFL